MTRLFDTLVSPLLVVLLQFSREHHRHLVLSAPSALLAMSEEQDEKQRHRDNVYFPFLCVPFPFVILRYGGISITYTWLFVASRILFHSPG